jgi:hypothetical protein
MAASYFELPRFLLIEKWYHGTHNKVNFLDYFRLQMGTKKNSNWFPMKNSKIFELAVLVFMLMIGYAAVQTFRWGGWEKARITKRLS